MRIAWHKSKVYDLELKMRVQHSPKEYIEGLLGRYRMLDLTDRTHLYLTEVCLRKWTQKFYATTATKLLKIRNIEWTIIISSFVEYENDRKLQHMMLQGWLFQLNPWVGSSRWIVEPHCDNHWQRKTILMPRANSGCKSCISAHSWWPK